MIRFIPYQITKSQQQYPKQMQIQNSIFYINRSLIPKNSAEQTLEKYNNVTLQDEQIKVVDLSMEITTHRVLLYSQNQHAFLVDGCKIKEVLISESGMLWSKEYYLKLRTDYGKVKFLMKNYKQAQITISSMLKNQAWNKVVPQVQQGPQMYSGIFNKIEKQKQKIDTNSAKVGESFTSFQSLFSNLRDIKEAMKQMRAISGDDAETGGSEINQILKDIGFVSVISKEEAGRDYVRQLAKELFTICNTVLWKKYGGMVALLDLFYFYNMKRQMQLVSPQQILQTCQQFQKFNLPAKLVTYKNNIKMIQSTQFDQRQDFEQQFRQYFVDYRVGSSAEYISRRKNLPLAIIEIKLKKACKRGDLAVDSRIEGTKYYKNLILVV